MSVPWRVFTGIFPLVVLFGCASEQSFPISPTEVVRVSDPDRAMAATTREWLALAHHRLNSFLPPGHTPPLLTEAMGLPGGAPVSVYKYFDRDPRGMNSIFSNLGGLLGTVQATGSRFGPAYPSDWPEFDDVWIPVAPGLEVAGRLGLACDEAGNPIITDCIVILAGLFGDNSTVRSRDLGVALREAGFHVLSLEQRGHGWTESRYPDHPYTFGVLEVGDIIAAGEWLQKRPEVRSTGLIGFCWGATEALLTAWEDGRDENHPDVAAGLKDHLRTRSGERVFTAGIVAFSPPLEFERLLDRLENRATWFSNPVFAALNDIVDARARQKGYPELDGDLRALTRLEAARACPDDPDFFDEGMRYVRLMPYRGLDVTNKLESIRVPTLVVYGIDDPVASAQSVADLLSQTQNPMVAGVILPGGGHCGFAPYSKNYFYSLLVSFFDRDLGAAACVNRSFVRARAMPKRHGP